MLRFLKKFAWVGLLAAMVQGAAAFSLLGPNAVWMTDDLSYNNQLDFTEAPGILDSPLGGPQNIGEEYRWNIPTLYYAVDQSFLDYFGSNGVVSIDQAMAILNSLSPVSSYSSNLDEVPMEATRENSRARALGLFDLKTLALHLMVEGLGLADPVRYDWTLRARVIVSPPGCPVFNYLVIQRNFDPASWEPSAYVNGTLYTYRIVEFCPVVDRADAFEQRVDPLQSFYTAVASPGIGRGSFFTGLTRDDIGGLRYLYRTNNVNFEESGPGTQTFVTNNTAQLITTSNLNFFAAFALTNNQAAVEGQFPGLTITSVSNTFVYLPTTNIVSTFTNSPWAPAGSPAQIVFSTNVTFTFQQIFQYTFANLFSVQLTTNGYTLVPLTTLTLSSNRAFNTVQTISATTAPFSPPGTLATTNITTRTFLTNQIGGEFIVLPPGVCDIAILSTLATNVTTTTNEIVTSTNTAGATNINGQFFSQTLIQFFTNHTFLYLPIICDTTNVSLNQGIEKITFIRRDFDSLLGRFFYPITNEYVLNSVTNSTIVKHRIRRVVNTPDILFTAADIVNPPPPVTGAPVVNIYQRDINFNSNNIVNNSDGILNGPGLIQPVKTVTFQKVGPAFRNAGPFFMDEPSNVGTFLLGSFDGTTNAPVVYPNGRSIMDYENEVLIHVSTTTLPGGTSGVVFTAQLQGTGGTTPYTWGLAPGSGPLPPGLGEFSAACNCWVVPSGGLISGTPTTPGTFNFTVLMTDASNQSVTQDLSITISP